MTIYRTAAIFALLQEKLGDCFGRKAYIPSSIELGFDVTQSIFEVGVTQRLEEIALALTSADPVAISSSLLIQSEVFLGIAESLNLSGFGKIAQYAIAAIELNPDASEIIATTALADFQAGRLAVLNGDRFSGGQPSLTLQQLSGLETISSESDYSETIDINPNYSDESDLSSLEAIWGEVEAISTQSWINEPLIHEQEIASWNEDTSSQNVLDSPPEEPEVIVNLPSPQNIPIHRIPEPKTTKKPAPNSSVQVEKPPNVIDLPLEMMRSFPKSDSYSQCFDWVSHVVVIPQEQVSTTIFLLDVKRFINTGKSNLPALAFKSSQL